LLHGKIIDFVVVILEGNFYREILTQETGENLIQTTKTVSCKENEAQEQEKDLNTESLNHDYASKEEIIVALITCLGKGNNVRQSLSYYSLGLLRYYFGCDNIRGLTSDDVVHNVIEKILGGIRKWDKRKFPELIDFIRVAILSYIRNERKRVDKYEELDLCEEVENENLSSSDYVRICIENDLNTGTLNAECFAELCTKLINSLNDDIYASFVLEKRLEGMKSNIQIAEQLGLEVKEVEKTLKRIKRKYTEVIKPMREDS